MPQNLSLRHQKLTRICRRMHHWYIIYFIKLLYVIFEYFLNTLISSIVNIMELQIRTKLLSYTRCHAFVRSVVCLCVIYNDGTREILGLLSTSLCVVNLFIIYGKKCTDFWMGSFWMIQSTATFPNWIVSDFNNV